MNKSIYDILGEAGECYQTKQFDKAIELFIQALGFEESNKSAVYSNLSVVAFAKKEYDQAIIYANKSLEIEPNFSEAHYNLANVLAATNKNEQSLIHYDIATTLNRNFFDAYYNKANVLTSMDENEKAIDSYEKALKCDSMSAKAYTNLAIAYSKAGRDDDAFATYSKALEINPSSESLWLNIALLLQTNKQYEQARLCFQNSLAINPDFAEAKWSYALFLLTIKEFEEGWRLYEERYNPMLRESLGLPNINKPKSIITDKKKSIFVASEQGFGDAIMFCRFLPELANKYKQVYFQPPKELLRVLQNSKPLSQAIAIVETDENLEFDEYTTIGSLPLLLNMKYDSVPLSNGYLNVQKSTKFDEIKSDKKFKVGLVWQGSIHIERLDKKRSIKLDEFSSLFELEDVSFYALQKGYGIEQTEDFKYKNKLTILSDKFNDFADTAQALSNLDLVITVDTSVAHLSAALGKQTWIMIDSSNCFRWSIDTDRSYWYSSVKLFRQTQKNDWKDVIKNIKDELISLKK